MVAFLAIIERYGVEMWRKGYSVEMVWREAGSGKSWELAGLNWTWVLLTDR